MKSPLIVTLGLLICTVPLLAAFDTPQLTTQLESTVRVEYRIHERPDDPHSPVIFTILISLEPRSISGNQVAWHASTIQFRKKGMCGAADTVWEAYDVEAETPDGLWRATHVDASAPSSAEFAMPPRFWGRAVAAIATDPDLDFNFRGRAYVPPPGGGPYEVTAGMDYDVHTAVGPEIPPGTDEPVDVPPVDRPTGD